MKAARRLFRSSQAAKPTGGVPDGLRLYVVGDIHGRLDLLQRVQQAIVEDASDARELVRHIVYLGDYVDRGPDSRGVIDWLCDDPLVAKHGFGATYLRGNHEEAFQSFLDFGTGAAEWLRAYGGAATLWSYGIDSRRPPINGTGLADLHDDLVRRVPLHHREFLAGLLDYLTVGDYLLVHAGIRPGVAIADQSAQDLRWIRREFLDSEADHGTIVVHGHSATREPAVFTNRIGIDTGAYATGHLTCLVLQSDEHRFLRT